MIWIVAGLVMLQITSLTVKSFNNIIYNCSSDSELEWNQTALMVYEIELTAFLCQTIRHIC